MVETAIALIYATFFSKAFAAKTTQLWTSVTGLSFAIGGTVTEFISCCIFLFVKHPYDIGDRVTVDGHELIVKHISLMYSVFRRVDNDGIIQIPRKHSPWPWSIGQYTDSIQTISQARSGSRTSPAVAR